MAGVLLFGSTRLLAVGLTVYRQITIIVISIVAAATMLWLYISFAGLQGHIQAIHGVMLSQELLIVVTALALASQSFSAIRHRVSHIVLTLLLIRLPLLYLWLLEPFGRSLLGWIPVLIETKGMVFVLILGLTLFLIVCSSALWATAAILLFLFAGTLIIMLEALITLAFPAG